MTARGSLRPRRKRLGQHFLIDGRVADRAVRHADLAPEDTVLEIGPGTGVLTRRIAPRVRRLVAIETDPRLARDLQALGAAWPALEVVHADATKVDLGSRGPFTKVVANLPYSVSTPLTFQLLPLPVRFHVLMYQREFAQRLVAEVGQDAYGRLGAARAYWARAEYLETVPASAFSPRPDVASALVRLIPLAAPPFPVSSPRAYEDLLRILFSTRRKTIRATLRHQARALGLPDAAAADGVARRWGLADERPEAVAPADFGRLTLVLDEAGHG